MHLVKMQKLRQTLESPDCMVFSAVIGFRNKNQSLNRSHTRSQTSRDKVYLRYFLAIESIEITAVISVCICLSLNCISIIKSFTASPSVCNGTCVSSILDRSCDFKYITQSKFSLHTNFFFLSYPTRRIDFFVFFCLFFFSEYMSIWIYIYVELLLQNIVHNHEWRFDCELINDVNGHCIAKLTCIFQICKIQWIKEPKVSS